MSATRLLRLCQPYLGLVPLLLLALLLPRRAFAYLDPATGSMIFQGAVAGILALTFTLKMYWKQLRSFFRRRGGRDEGSPDA
ncbi:MAG: hypothetical protein JXX28_14310 [Deltaproteobacteria bacterium]|nr:hypothetical protein [Deltaproteobacteria bacterium]